MDELTSTEKNHIRHDSDEIFKEYRRRIVREAQRKRRAKAREKGLCLICAKHPAMENYSVCEECYARVRKWQRGQK